MPANTNPIFTLTPNCNATITSGTANSGGRQLPNNLTDVLTGGTNGTRLEGLLINVSETIAASGLVQIFEKVGATYYLLGEVAYSAQTPSPTSAASSYNWMPSVTPFILASGNKISISTTTANKLVIKPIAGDF